MVKYLMSMVTFEEIPSEVTLSLSITNCQERCPGCHSPELRCNIGVELTNELLDCLITQNSGISCVLFLGEGDDKDRLLQLARRIKEHWNLKIALYSGRDKIESDIWDVFDYIKIGSYRATLGPLNSITTNQRLFQRKNDNWEDITKIFWRK